MGRASPIKTSYNGGELAEKLDGRVDISRAAAALQLAENAIAQVQGGGSRRPGTRFVAPVRYHDKQTYQIDFRFSTEQAYTIELGEGYVRFYRNHGALVESAKTITAATQSNPVVISTVGSHGYSTGQDIEHTGIVGMTQLNGRRFRVGAVTATSYELFDQFGVALNGTAFSAYVSGGLAMRVYTVATPYLEADLAAIKYTQSNDVLYLAHRNYVPRKLIRLAAVSWTLETVDFLDGPYLPQNGSQATLAPSATSGAGITISSATTKAITNCTNNGSGLIRVTSANHGWLTNNRIRIAGVTGTVEANGDWDVIRINASTYDLRGSVFVNAYAAGGAATPLIFAPTDLGRLVRIKHSSTWGYAKIIAYNSEVSVDADVLSNFGATTAQTAWRLGLYSQTYGYPNAVTFFEDRLGFGGCPLAPTRIDLSKTGDYENFAPTATDGTVANDNAVAIGLNSGDANAVRWMRDDEKGLLVGTVGGEWLVRANSLGEALTPSNVKATRTTTYGSADRQPVRAGKDVVFNQRGKRKVRNLNYVFEDDGYRAGDLTLLADHMTRSGMEQMAYQAEPDSIIWGIRGDGQATATSYSRDQEAIGWTRNLFGGTSDKWGRKFAEARSVACIPAPADVGYDEAWFIVRRYIGTKVVQYVEWQPPAWEQGDDQRTAFYVDSGLVFDGAQAVTVTPGIGATVKDTINVPFIAAGAVFAAGDVGRKIVQRWFDWSYRDKHRKRGIWRWSIATITAFDSNVQVRATIAAAFGDTDEIAAGGWSLTSSVITGLWHLEGLTVQVNGDGADLGDYTVANGSITLSSPVSYAIVGLGYETPMMLLRLDAGGQDGTSQAKIKKVPEVTFRLYETLGCQVGPDFDSLHPITFRKASDNTNEAPPIQGGDYLMKPFGGGNDTEGRICMLQDRPFPMTVLAVMPQVITSDKG